MTACHNCGTPSDPTETHHHNERKGDNEPDNLQARCRRCHHDEAHDNPRAVDDQSEQRFGPKRPTSLDP